MCPFSPFSVCLSRSLCHYDFPYPLCPRSFCLSGHLVHKQTVVLLPGMSSDSEIDCDTENEDEVVALEAGDCRYDAQALPCAGAQLNSDDLCFTTGENTER
ncbi:unnamed protein product [Oncorhynchus mykiss]|uniref:Uncharacterized protein n=1 Tax=Oncorhynchus mykiss TaxID=8022 RepID=A0A060Y272_ONCMY|nr:unnamed protein product [Oncorhynchus mykiss]